ncbi:hypothetical protein BN946_scf184470.g14 [Trametes cinnabarina]|uniref:RING-type E3 ubiquitin transferase (cysteine targeting) n=1 Tax=Pycnoporus cinnabarinus TaxID=5643 RepID=A0A060SQ16_PYCCI|nr:hypothetical protein BN946_scf184470.g14 [Trametes cinnabarina]
MSSISSQDFQQSWQNAWNHARNRIPEIESEVAVTRFPLARVTRVGKVDAELLDAELVQLLKEPLTKALGLANSTLKARLEPELALLIHLVLYKFSVWDQGASYGAKLQGLKYLPPKLKSQYTSPLLNFVFFLWNGRYRTLADRLLGLRLVASRRHFQREVSYEFMNRQMVWHAFTEFLLFLLPLINTRAVRRQTILLISRLTVALSSVLPAPLRSSTAASGSSQEKEKARRGKYWMLPEDQCAICAENASTNFADPANALQSMSAVSPYATTEGTNSSTYGDPDQPPRFPIQTPYITSCGHVYCYYCLTERMMRTADERSGAGPRGTQWECLRCGEGVIAADRLEIQAEGPDYMSGVDDEEEDSMSRMSFEFGSEDVDTEFTDMSGSMGSYTDNDSGMSSE